MIDLPVDFVKTMRNALGDEYQFFEQALNEPQVTSVRMNDKVALTLSDERVPWCAEGYYLAERPVFTLDPMLHGGAYYVQEASSMFLSRVASRFFPDAERVLDLCAAPGGKSTLLVQNLSDKTLLVSNELVRSRAHILAENMIKWGCPNVVVTNNRPDDFARLPGYFDAVVVDAPCSGEGMFRKDAQAVSEWSLQNVEMCAARQREILRSAWNTLKNGGILVYSTCTYNTQENEDNVRWTCEELGAEYLAVDIEDLPCITETDRGYHFYPHKTRGEGFFIAVMRKTGEAFAERLDKKSRKKSEAQCVSYKEALPFALSEKEKWSILCENDRIKAYPTDRKADFLLLNNELNVLHSGISLGQIKGKSFIPDISIALSKALDIHSVNKVEVDYPTAIAYLRRENIILPDAKQGYLLLAYKGLPLGWAKNLGNRCNNNYPQEWRIRKLTVESRQPADDCQL